MFGNPDGTQALVFDILPKKKKTIELLLLCFFLVDKQTMRKGLTLCPIPRPETFPAARPRLEANPHLITRGTNVARLLITTEHN